MSKKTHVENSLPAESTGEGVVSTALLDPVDPPSVVEAAVQGNGDSQGNGNPPDEGSEGGTSLESARVRASNTDHRSLSTTDKPGVDGSAHDDVSDLALEDIGAESLEALSGFDPSVHAVTPEGLPKMNKDGTYAKKRGRKAGATVSNAQPASASINSTTATPNQAAPSLQVQAPISHKVIAQQYAHIFFLAGYTAFGNDWLPDDATEKSMVEKSIQTYVEANNVEAMSPGMGLLLTLGAYSVKRAQRETVKSKLMGIKDKAISLYTWARSRFGG